MMNRRDFLGITAGASAVLAIPPQLLRALELQQSGTLIQRAIPSTGEKLPVIGLTLSNHSSCADPAALKAVVRTFVDNGGRVFDAMHQSGAESETVTVRILDELGVQDKLFFSWRSNPPGTGGGPSSSNPDAVRAYIQSLPGKFKVPKIDLVMGGTEQLPILKEMKKAGVVRYIGISAGGQPGYPSLNSIMIMRNEPIDFIGVNYTIASPSSYAVANRNVEDVILPLALERKIGVMAYSRSAAPTDSVARATPASLRVSPIGRFRSGPPSSTRRRGRSSS